MRDTDKQAHLNERTNEVKKYSGSKIKLFRGYRFWRNKICPRNLLGYSLMYFGFRFVVPNALKADK